MDFRLEELMNFETVPAQAPQTARLFYRRLGRPDHHDVDFRREVTQDFH